jgi:FkbM family methyltransferase
MSRPRGVIGRLQQRAAAAKKPASEPRGGDGSAPLKVAREERDVDHLLEMAGLLSPHKQISMHERLPVPEIQLDNGVTITAFSKKELRRFTRPIDDEVLAWLGALTAGNVFFDIGANCGSLSLTAGAMHGAGVPIVAIEPAYASFESLVRNLSRNGMLEFAIPLQIALMDRTGIERINYYGTTAAGTSKHAVGTSRDQEGNEFTPVETQVVPAFTLDDAIDLLGLPHPTHVKIDVDGAETTLLRGAERTLARGSIAELLVEIIDHDRAGTRLDETTRVLGGHGSELAATIAHNPDDEKSFVADYLFRRP